MNYQELIEKVCGIADGAGKKILAIYAKADHQVSSKQDSSPLTAADLASHQHICNELERLTPDIPVLSEESAHIPYSERSLWDTYWLVDPLDGTKEFVKRNGEFSVLIALIKNHEVLLGVVHAPVLGTTWYAYRGKGAYKKIDNQFFELKVRDARPPYTVVGSRSHAGDSLQVLLNDLESYELVSMGSILKACLVADGRADIYPRFGPTSEWDTAAAQIIVEEAGGKMVQADGEPLKYNTKPSLLNPYFLVVGENYLSWLKYIPTNQNT